MKSKKVTQETAEKNEVPKETESLRSLYKETVPYLLHWFEYNRRILPWREDPTPYHVWVSEIMLQQTRVEAVKGYYDRFLTYLPEIKDLAQATEETLLKLWEGLGYYNRVRNMQKAALVIMEQYDGEMPGDYEKLRGLPGIGDYTAGAIASIAFGLPYPAVDGNVLRVMSRIACNRADITKDATKRTLTEDLKSIMPKESGDFNQSLMELGATVCIPNGKPLCEQCPVMHLCRAFQNGQEMQLPVKAPKKERRIEKRTVYLVFLGDKVLLHRREEKGLLAGLWEFPNCIREKSNRNGKKAKHIFSHVEWHMEGIRIEVQNREEMTEQEHLEYWRQQLAEGPEEQERWVFATVKEMKEKYPIPSAFEAYVKEICKEEEE